jgi:ribosomal protein L37AE/L43A
MVAPASTLGIVPDHLCPNCGREHAGLFSSDIHSVRHCGCFYEGDPSKVRFHISDPLERSLEAEFYKREGAH